MNLAASFVNNPIKVSVGVLLVALFGAIALWQMPMQLTPDVDTPTITIETRWPGASPQEVEREIVVEQEEQLKGVEGVTKMSSESADSMGKITLEFQVGTNMEEALLKVNSRLQQVREYPLDADQPVLTTANSSDSPIAWFILSPRPPSAERIEQFKADHPQLAAQLEPIERAANVGVQLLRLRLLAQDHPEFSELLPPADLDVAKLKRFAEDEIEARFERVAGVSQSNVVGGLEDEMQVIVDPEKLAARGLTLTQVRDVLVRQNRDTSAGDFWEGPRRYVVRSLGEFRSKEQVEAQLLGVQNGAPVYVRDVAEVRLGYKKPDGLVRRFGTSCLAVNCLRETGANVLDIMAELKSVRDDLNANLLAPRGLLLTQAYDETEYINSSVSLVQENIFVGGALTMVVLMIFLHVGLPTLLTAPLLLATALAAAYLSPWWFAVTLAIVIGTGFAFARGALVVGLAIPISIIGTFLILGVLGRSLNVISLAGLAFAVGMLVDNAVVVLENIYRRYDLGETPMQAAVRGTQEVWGAVLASTLTTVAVFLPVVFVEQEAGQLFRDIALAISGAVGLSLIVSIVVIPPAAARLLHRRSPEENLDLIEHGRTAERKHQPWAARMLTGFGNSFIDMVVGINAWIQRGILRQLAVVAIMVGASAALTWMLWPKVEYLPTGNRNLVFGILLPPPGYNIDQLMQMGETVEANLRPYWDVDPGDEAKLDGPAVADFFFVARGRQVFMGLRARDPLRSGELVPVIQRAVSSLPGTIGVAQQSSLFERGLGEGRTIDIEITGPEVTKLVQIGGRVIGQVGQIIPGVQAVPKPSLDLSIPEVHVEPKLVQAAEMQMSTSDIGFAVNALVDGAYVGDYFLEGKKIDLTVIGENKYSAGTHLVGAIPVATPLGQIIPLNALAKIELTSGPEQVNHRERIRAITIQVTPPVQVALEDAMQMIQTQIVAPIVDEGLLGDTYRIQLAGTADKLRETWDALKFNVMLALLITYLLMAALFESWLYPLVIIMVVPLGAVGGVLGLAALNVWVLQPLDVLTMLGFVVLIGTVVNNPILIVDQSLQHMRNDGYSPRQAVLEAVGNRIRPIFMTTTTTVLGLLPLVLFPGAGSELYRGLGSVVLGGLVVSTAFTLILVPTLFTLTVNLQRAVGFTKSTEAHDLDDEPPVPPERRERSLASPVA